MLAVTTFLSSPESVGIWTAVPQRSRIRFENKTMWGAMKVRGEFTEFSGSGQIEDARTVSGRIEVKAASVRTGLGKRDEDLRSAAFFDVERYPNITVDVAGGEPIDDDTVRLNATLTAKGITAPLPLQAHVEVLGDGEVCLTAQTTVARKQFAVEGNMFGMVGAKTTLKVSLVFAHESAQAPK
ncbi:YceI family protein [Candidatus Mycobacterium methanotrophicum]|uniref:YceI family protein n=1 Tax=Candidatus Mycobacterium methanotrophicum TaxID=2943498 RepID=A0ABY4QNT1_9MYCO|nr:YceI family protein [Candidatus Mycobacterium methanotrophicum]UQX11902.1 YceI family protein [Candidatus Mycobacterium methanotrophicum]